VTVAVSTVVSHPVRHVGQVAEATVTVGVVVHREFAQGTESVVDRRMMHAGAGPQSDGRVQSNINVR